MFLVIGGSGHLGNVLVRLLLKEDKKIRVIVPPNEDLTSLKNLDVEVFFCDIRDKTTLKRAFKDIEVVFHLASLISVLPRSRNLIYDVNINGTKNVLDLCLESNVKRLLYVSSVHALKEPSHNTPLTENKDFDPQKVVGDYAKSKAIATKEVLKSVENGADAVVVHPSGIIGPYDYKLSFMSHVIINYVKKRYPFGINGGYDFVDVRDVAQGIILAYKYGKKGENYILSGEYISIKDLFKILEELTDIKAPSVFLPAWCARFLSLFANLYYYITNEKPTFTSYAVYTLTSNSLMDHTKATKEFGYNHRPIKESIKDTVNWLKEKGLI